MLILVTNDDGINAKGLEILEAIAKDMGDTVVVAPETEQSGVSHAITLLRALRVRKINETRFALDGTPTDCVFIASNYLMKQKPDLVLSGINNGPNLGYDVMYSGTVAAAVEGALKGIPSIAVSLTQRFDSMELAMEPARTAINALWPIISKKPMAINVNIPDPLNIQGYKTAKLGRRIYSGDVIVRTDPRGREYLWIGGSRVFMDNEKDTDCGLIQQDYVTISPLGINLVDGQYMDDVKQAVQRITGEWNAKEPGTAIKRHDQDNP